MWTSEIGKDAGKVWQSLSKEGKMDLNAIKKIVNSDDKNLYMALGWLAREGKVKFEQKQKQILVDLTEK